MHQRFMIEKILKNLTRTRGMFTSFTRPWLTINCLIPLEECTRLMI